MSAAFKFLLAFLPQLGSVSGLWQERLRRIRRKMLLLGLAAAAAATGVAFALSALFLYLQAWLPAWQAAALIGAGAIAATVVLVVVAGAGGTRARPPRQDAVELQRAQAFVAGLGGESGLRGTDLVIASLVAGILLGARAERPAERPRTDP